jgi:hypothetical protein
MKFELEFRSIHENGLPKIDSENTSAIFLWDGNIYTGWPLSPIKPGIPIEDEHQINWEEAQTGEHFSAVKYWAYWPKEMKDASLK